MSYRNKEDSSRQPVSDSVYIRRNDSSEKWSDVFSIKMDKDAYSVEREYRQAVESNRAIYQEIPHEAYETIDACVNHAIVNGHHGAFVHYYLEKACDGDDLFHNAFQKCVEMGKDAVIATVEDLKKCLILKPKYWHSPDMYLGEDTMQQGAWFYTETLLARQNKDRNDPYWSKPSREALIQYGFYLRLNEKQVNELLLLAGYAALYACDPVDGVCMYFLNRMAEEENEYCYARQFDGRKLTVRMTIEKLITVKSMINHMSEQVALRTKAYFSRENVKIVLWETEQLTLEETKALSCMGIEYKNYKDKKLISDLKSPDNDRLRELQLIWDRKKSQLIRVCYVRVPAFSSKLMKYQNGQWNIIGEVELLAERMGYKAEQSEKMVAMYPTFYMKEWQDMHDLEQNLMQYGAFKRYGYLYQSCQFLNSRKYRKNLYYTTYPLTNETRISLERDLDGQDGVSLCFISDIEGVDMEKHYISDVAEQFCEGMDDTKSLKDENLLYQVWKLKNLFEEKKSTCIGRLPEFTTLSHILYGRMQPQQKNSTEKNCQKELYYEYEVGDKASAIQMALATGNEEFLGQYLCLAGFWTTDMYEGYIPQIEEIYERLDAFVVYLLKFRDALIHVWMKDYLRRERTIEKQLCTEEGMLAYKIEEEFPMVRLAMTINRDIQFVLREFSEEKEYGIRDYLYGYLVNMVYPIRFSTNRWYEEYANGEYFDEETGKLKKRKGGK